MQYINTHQVLQNLRQQAKESKRPGPHVVVAGPTDTGKSSLCKMLLNWAVRSDHQPTYVDLDIGKPSCCQAVPQLVLSCVLAAGGKHNAGSTLPLLPRQSPTAVTDSTAIALAAKTFSGQGLCWFNCRTRQHHCTWVSSSHTCRGAYYCGGWLPHAGDRFGRTTAHTNMLPAAVHVVRARKHRAQS